MDKFADYPHADRAENGIFYVDKAVNAMISVKVKQTVDLGTHLMFIGEVTEEKYCPTFHPLLISTTSITSNRNRSSSLKVKGLMCKICGYVYEGETLPPDFICPVANTALKILNRCNVRRGDGLRRKCQRRLPLFFYVQNRAKARLFAHISILYSKAKPLHFACRRYSRTEPGPRSK